MSDVKWYILRVVSGQEKKIKAYLEKDLSIHGLEEYIPQILTPTEKVWQIRKMKGGKTKKIAVDKNFFPGYVLIFANLEDSNQGEIIHKVKSVPGVMGFLEVDGRDRTAKPKPMRESEIKRILGRIEKTDQNDVQHAVLFMVGENVKVMEGAFSGFTGTVDEIYEDKKKIKVIVKIFGRNTPIELSYGQVEKED